MQTGQQIAVPGPIAGKRVMVCGGGGFIGARLVERLAAAGAQVTATVRPGSPPPAPAHTVAELDLTDADRLHELVASQRPDYVVNLARGRGDRTPDERRTLVAETLGVTAELIEAASASGCSGLLQLGSPTEYGRPRADLEESLPAEPETLFGAAKAAATALCIAAARGGRITATVLRPFIVYGPADRPDRLIGRAIAAGTDGGELALTGRLARRDWVYVDDVVDACMLALDGRAAGEVVNVATGIEHTNEEVVAEVASALGRPVRIAAEVEPARAWDAPHWSGSTRKAEQLLGWRAQTTLSEGIARTVAAAQRGGTR